MTRLNRQLLTWKSLHLLLVSVLAVVVATGCGRKEQVSTEPDIDLSKAQDIFAAPSASLRSPDTVVVTVNGKAVTERDVATEAQNFTARLRMRLPPERVAQMQGEIRQQAIDGLVMRELLRKAVDDEKIAVTDDDMKEMTERISANLPPDVTIEQHLARLNLDEAALREALRIDKLLQDKAGEPDEPTDEEIAAFYEENKARFELPESVSASHILIAFEPDDDQAAKEQKRTQIQDIRKQLDEGADFAEMAKQHSDCPSKAQGGQLGTFGKGRMVPEFEQAAFSQPVGEIGPVVETQYGFHIIQITKHDEPRTSTLDEVKPGITRMLSTKAQQGRIEQYLTGLREKAAIKYAEMP